MKQQTPSLNSPGAKDSKRRARKLHRNFKLDERVDAALRLRSKQLKTTQTAILEGAVLGLVPMTRADLGFVQLSERAQRALLREAARRKESPLATVEAILLEALR